MPAPVLAGPRSVVIGGRPGARCFHDTRVLCRVSVSRAPSVLSSLCFLPSFRGCQWCLEETGADMNLGRMSLGAQGP